MYSLFLKHGVPHRRGKVRLLSSYHTKSGVVRGLVVWLTDSWCAGASEEVVVTPHDSFGNPGASGGRLAAELVQEEGGPPDADPTPCHVVESTTGGLPASLEPTA